MTTAAQRKRGLLYFIPEHREPWHSRHHRISFSQCYFCTASGFTHGILTCTALYIHAKWNLILSVCPCFDTKANPQNTMKAKAICFLQGCSCIIKNHSAPWQYSQHSLSWHIKLAMRTKSKSFQSPTAPVHQFKPHYVLVPVIIPPHIVSAGREAWLSNSSTKGYNGNYWIKPSGNR